MGLSNNKVDRPVLFRDYTHKTCTDYVRRSESDCGNLLAVDKRQRT